MFIECSFAPEQLRVFLQCGKQQQPESAAAHNFADEDGEREQRNRLRRFRYFCDNKRHDDRVCCNRRQRSKPCTKGHAARQSTGGAFPEFPKSKSSDCADKRCKAAENKIIRQCACYQIGQQAADKQPGNRGRGKIRQNCQCFGYTKLKYAAHGRNEARCKRQYRVQRSTLRANIRSSALSAVPPQAANAVAAKTPQSNTANAFLIFFIFFSLVLFFRHMPL